MKLKEFLETIPPYVEMEIEDININNGIGFVSNTTEIFTHCSYDRCDGDRYFVMDSGKIYNKAYGIHNYTFTCKNCDQTKKIISVMGKITDGYLKGKMIKIGEYPSFGKPLPTKLISIIGPDRDLFIKGKRSENQGLGIGSYAYYRRVVELQKNRIIDQIIKICMKEQNSEEIVNQLNNAKNENQFSKAIDLISGNLPGSLLIDGRNPLKLLHKALSKGIHDMSDEECLERAQSIRILLSELTMRMSEILKEEKELSDAIKRLDLL